MPDSPVPPFVCRTEDTKSLHFSLHAVQSRMRVDRPDRLELAYTRTMMGFLALQPAPQAIAMIGLGGGSLAKFIHQQLPQAFLKVVEINPHVIALREEFEVPPDSERFRVRLADGADFVRSPPQPFDVLLVDGFDYHGQPPALASQAFYDDCAALLSPEGVLVANLYAGDPDYERQLARIERAFAHQVLQLPDPECSNTIVFAGRQPLRARLGEARNPGLSPAAWAQVRGGVRAVQQALAQPTAG
ncbi:spermine/spermidine synthase domain-containing protein [Inhella proteolytica]|nr:transferase [Inhella proteolytica]